MQRNGFTEKKGLLHTYKGLEICYGHHFYTHTGIRIFEYIVYAFAYAAKLTTMIGT